MSYEVVLWDLGGVLVDVAFSIPARRWATRYGRSWSDLEKAFFETGLKKDFDCGKFTSEQVCKRLSSQLDLVVRPEDFIPIWRDVVTVRTHMLRTFMSVNGGRRCAVLSNTDPVHTQSMRQQFANVDGFVFNEWVVSWEQQSCKPDQEIYHAAMIWADVAPNRILFIDDRAENVAAASQLGLNAIKFEGSKQLLRTLDSLPNDERTHG